MLRVKQQGQIVRKVLYHHLSALQLDPGTRNISTDLTLLACRWEPSLKNMLVQNNVEGNPAFVETRKCNRPLCVIYPVVRETKMINLP